MAYSVLSPMSLTNLEAKFQLQLFIAGDPWARIKKTKQSKTKSNQTNLSWLLGHKLRWSGS